MLLGSALLTSEYRYVSISSKQAHQEFRKWEKEKEKELAALSVNEKARITIPKIRSIPSFFIEEVTKPEHIEYIKQLQA